MILITDGEEAGLMGAAALVTDREVTSRLQAYVDLEAIGSAGTPTLFEPDRGTRGLSHPGPAWLPTLPAPLMVSRSIVACQTTPIFQS